MRAFALAALLVACAPTGNVVTDTILYGPRTAMRVQPRSFPLGDGRTGWEVTCDQHLGMSACYQRAAAICAEYDVISTTENSTGRAIVFACKDQH
jgi:hypothetical protein